MEVNIACLVAPATAAIVTSFCKKKIPAKYHFDWLILMYIGGTVMLLVDHVLNGEIVFYFPFFTAGRDEILREIIGVGIPMTFALLLFWLILVTVVNALHKRSTLTV